MTAIRQLWRSDNATRTLVIFPHAGGSANYYRHWTTTDAGLDILAIQYPGRSDRLGEPFHHTLTDLADELTAELTALPNQPTTFLGHSMGAIVAFEVARRREAGGEAAVTLIASAAQPPLDPLTADERKAVWDEDQAMDWLVDTGQIAPELSDDRGIREVILPYICADYEMLQRYEYVPGPPLRGDILAVTGLDDPDVTDKDALAWREFTAGRFRHVALPGGHFYLTPDPPIPLFADPFP